jgi:saccharopine dehydrogenase (NAD+, L-lysine forming)
VNACDPRFNPSIFEAAFAAGCNYLDMAMTLSEPHPDRPYDEPGVMLGEQQFAASDGWKERGLLALVGMGVEPGLSDVFARYAADHLFSAVEEVGVRDGSDLVIDGYDFAPTFSIWTTIEECLNPPLVWERDRGWYTTRPFSEPETFVFPAGIGAVECVNVEHEEVLLIPRWVACERVTFKYGLGEEFIEVLRVLDRTGLASTKPVRVRGADVSPRDLVAAVLPDPASLGDRMHGRTCAGTWVRGTGADGRTREVYLYHVADNAETMAKHAAQAVVWQTAINPVVAMELLATGVWSGAGVLGPEAFDAVPFLDRLRARGEEWLVEERSPGVGPRSEPTLR